jgi:hypothetical protein
MPHHNDTSRTLAVGRLIIGAAALAVMMAGGAGAASQSVGTGPIDAVAARQALREVRPMVRFYEDDDRLVRVYGTHLSQGDSPEAAAAAFVRDHSAVFGVPAADLLPLRWDGAASHVQPVMYLAAEDRYRFTLVHYTQYRNGLKVFRSDLRLLVNNAEGYPVTLAASSLRDLGDFTVAQSWAVLPEPAQVAPGMDTFSAVETVIFAGVDGAPADPAVAIVFVAERGNPVDEDYEKWLYVVDVQTGAVLHRESEILHAAVSGNVSGTITEAMHASSCAEATPVGLPYARVAVGEAFAYADEHGDFVIESGGSGPVTISAGIRGLYFSVQNFIDANDQQSLEVSAPGVADFVFDIDTEHRRAERDAYYHANLVRDFLLSVHPDYPIIPDQTDFTVNVNLPFTCQAWYNGTSLNFRRAGSSCANTAFGSVVHHEFGHHIVQTGGSGQGEYGEGMSDVIAMLLSGEARMFIGFASCDEGIRDADNPMQYPCSGASHHCGQLLSGCVWDTWQALKTSDPVGADETIREIAISSILLHAGTSITPQICIDFLALDDDDANPENGTPHDAEILIGFGLHNMHPWGGGGTNDLVPLATPVCPGDVIADTNLWAGRDINVSCDPSLDHGTDVWYAYTPATDGTLSATLCPEEGFEAIVTIHTAIPNQGGAELDCERFACCEGCGTAATAGVTAGHTYYIRVAGWGESRRGSFGLSIDGPPCAESLVFSFPEGAPEDISPTTGRTFVVRIEPVTPAQTYLPGTATLHYRYDSAPFRLAPMVELGDDLFSAELPPDECGETAEFFVSAHTDQSPRLTWSANPSTHVFRASVGTFEGVVIEDDFEADLGWTVSGDATDGQWGRAIPRNCDRGDPPTDYDGTGQCFVTDNGNCLSDVDAGATHLTSPPLDVTGLTDPRVRYAYWFDTNAAEDLWIVDVRRDGGAWVEVLRQSTSNAWRVHEFRVTDFVAPGGVIEVRFTADDIGAASVVEAGVDAFRVFSVACDGCESIPAGEADLSDYAAMATCLAGPDQPAGPQCACFDLSEDGSVDLRDYHLLQTMIAAP